MKSRRIALWPMCLLLAVLAGCQSQAPVAPPPDVPDISHIEAELRRLAEAPLIPLEPATERAGDEESYVSPTVESVSEADEPQAQSYATRIDVVADEDTATEASHIVSSPENERVKPADPPWAKDLPNVAKRSYESAARTFETAQHEQRLRVLRERQRLFELRSQEWLESAAQQHVSHHELAYRLRLIATLRTSLGNQFEAASKALGEPEGVSPRTAQLD